MQYLDEADSHRQSDLDGSGNLSNRALVRFCDFFLKTCLDQIDYMTDMLRLQDFLDRIEGYVHARHGKRLNHRPDMSRG